MNLDDLIVATLQNRKKKYVDLIFNSNPVLKAFKIGNIVSSKRRGEKIEKTVSGGTKIEIPLAVRNPGVTGWYYGADILETTTQSFSSMATFEWKQGYTFVGFTGREVALNQGDYKLIDLVARKVEFAEKQMLNWFHSALLVTTPASKAINSIPFIISDTPSTGTFAGISRASNIWWRNLYGEIGPSASTQFDGMSASTALDTRIRRCWSAFLKFLDRGDSRPTVILAGRTWYDALVSSFVSVHRINAPQSDIAVDMGIPQAIDFEGIPVIPLFGYDYTQSNLLGSYLSDYAYFINTDYMYLAVHPERSFTLSEPVKPFNQDAFGRYIFWMGELVCENLSAQGVLRWRP